jgi:hypothetical protein
MCCNIKGVVQMSVVLMMLGYIGYLTPKNIDPKASQSITIQSMLDIR